MLDLLNELIAVADTHFDGHLTIMKFTRKLARRIRNATRPTRH